MKIYISLLFLFSSSFLLAQGFERSFPDLELGSIASINIHESGIGYAPQECGVLLKTIDGGETWTQIFPDVSDASYQGYVVFLDDNDPDKLVYYSQYSIVKTDDGFATTQSIKPIGIAGLMQDFILMENGNFGLLANTFYYSSDEGETWDETSTPEVDGIDLFELNGALYACYRAILRSTDGGVTFDTVFHNSDTKRKFVELNGKPIVSSSDHLYTSQDDGITWEEIPAMDYYGSASNLNAYNNRLIANTSNRINYSDDGGMTWTSVIMPEGVYRTGCMFVNDTGRIYIGGEASQIYVTDDPDTPLVLDFGYQEELYNITGSGLRLVATGADGELIRSEDGGESWTRNKVTDRHLDLAAYIGDRLFVLNDMNNLQLVGEDNSVITVLTIDDYYINFEVMNAMEAYISTNTSILLTTDGGENWSEVYSHPIELKQVHLTLSGDLSLLDDRGDIYLSQDLGNSFQMVASSPDTNANFLDFVVFDEMNYMVLSSSMLFVTEDAGNNWTSSFRPYNGLRLYPINSSTALCLGVNSSDGWLYKTDDRGNTFPEIAETCSTTSRGAYFDSATNTLWTVGSGLGIQKNELMISSFHTAANPIQTTKLYPNPGKDILYISTDISETSTISVFNALGMQVASYVGNRSSLDISGFTAGQYQLIIQDGNKVWMGRFVKTQ